MSLRTQTWRVGSATVTRVEEQLGPASFPPEQYFSGFEPELLQRHLGWLVPHHYRPETRQIVTSVHAWLIRTPRHVVLLDCCAGNHKERPWLPRFHRLQTPFLQRLAAAGVAPEQVDFVLCTHLHADHIGWNTCLRDGRWVPTFPNARYLFGRREFEQNDPQRHPEGADADARRIAWADSVLPVLEGGQALLVDPPHAIDDLLTVEAAPGHTPGHVLLKLKAPGGGAVFCGDALHHPLQVVAPHWNSRFCECADEARATRLRLLEDCAAEGTLLLPTHFGAPHAARVARPGEAPRFVEPDGG